MSEKKSLIGRRKALKSLGAIGVSACSIPVVGVAKKANRASKTVMLDTDKLENVNHGVTKFYESGQNTTILSGVVDTTNRGKTQSYRVTIENGNVPEHAQAHLQKTASRRSHRPHREGVHHSGEEIQEKDDGSIGTSDHSSKDTGTDYEGGAVIRTGPSYERDCVTKQFVRWTSQNGAVDWAWRGWCSWHGIDWETLMDGFADSQFESDGEYYTKSLGDYSPKGEDDKVYHRVKLWAEPDGQMRWAVVMDSRNSEWGENYGHTADVYTTDDPYDDC